MTTVDVRKLDDEELSALADSIVQEYGRRCDESSSNDPPEISLHKSSTTDVAVFSSALLKATNLEIFELAMWHLSRGTR